MQTIEYLQKNGLENLNKEYGIEYTIHPNDGRIILNYSQINSHHCKFHPIVRECRGLVLDNDYNLIARAFPRFYNLGEDPKQKFNWSSFIANEKVDGSLIIAYWWNDSLHINTRGSFGNGLVGKSSYTWRQLFELAVNIAEVREICIAGYTLCFELCTPYNQVVAYHESPKAFLLSAFHGVEEVHYDFLTYLDYDFAQVFYEFSNVEEILTFINKEGKKNPTFEGLVLRDDNNERIKVKSEDYLRLHRLSNNGHVADFENILDAVLEFETAEIVSVFSSLRPKVTLVEDYVYREIGQLQQIWEEYKNIKSRKEFANAVKSLSFSFLLFAALDSGINPSQLFYKKEFRDKVIKTMSNLYRTTYENYR